MKIIAHRGNSSACHQNTMAAFERAVADGADAIEFDVRLTKDRQWVVHHDADIISHSTISALTLAEVSRLKVGPNLDPIPRLDDFLLWAREQRIEFVFDIKDREGVPELVQTVERAGVAQRAIFSSFHHRVLKELELSRPDWPRALIVGSSRSALARRLLIGSILRWSIRHRLTALHLEEHWVVPSLLERMKSAGLRLAVWTVDDPLRMTLLDAFGVGGLITNKPDLARTTLRGGR